MSNQSQPQTPKSPEFMIIEARLLMSRGELNDARYEIEECLSQFPHHPEAYALRDEIERLMVEDTVAANEFIETELSIGNPSIARWYVAAAVCLLGAIAMGIEPLQYCIAHGFTSTIYIHSGYTRVPYPAHFGFRYSAILLAITLVSACQARIMTLQARKFGIKGR